MAEKVYDVYGIGNALVDMEYSVNEQFLSSHRVDKGVMTLVDEVRQNQLVQALNHNDVKKQCGGSAANSIIAISQLGGACFYSCKVAGDESGKFYLKDLSREKVDSNLVIGSLPEGITGKCLVMITPDAERTMNTFLGITSEYSESDIYESALKRSKYIYIEGYLVANPDGRAAMKRGRELAEKYKVKTSLTFSDPSMTRYFRDGLQDVIGDYVDLLFCNEEEAKIFTDSADIKEAGEKLKKFAHNFAITRGKYGALVYDGGNFIDINPYPVKAVDTNGAGDMFAGAFLYGITHGYGFADAGRLASMASSRVVSNFGPRMERSETRLLLSEFKSAVSS
jgi:sugar/nucleoside kinase (ribokinase family)